MVAATVTKPRLARAPGTDRWRWSGGGAGAGHSGRAGAGQSGGAGAASSMSGLPGLVVVVLVVVGTSSCMSSLVTTWLHTVASSGGHKGHCKWLLKLIN